MIYLSSGMSKTSATVYINQVLTVLENMAKTKIRIPTTQDEMESIRCGFEKFAGFPDVIGAIDDTFVRIN
ncbi:hypothetical protein PHMEG_00020 [Phytophthora megakarya]|uniref:Nuclease HARBI1 n=1 Tax=Phytophthora megakarya TaxID=4795 RepID=A0A225X6D6_9STRA|nr:hypothetical protein PHMEG_00020 [Phytophthora megakarya]